MIALRHALLSASLVVASYGSVAPPQDPNGSRPASARAARVRAFGDRIVVEPGEHALADLVARSSEILQRVEMIEWNPAAPATTSVRIPALLDLDRAGFEEAVAALLFGHRYVLTPLDADKRIFQWVFLGGQGLLAIAARPTPRPLAEVRAGRGPIRFVQVTYPLKGIDPIRAANYLRPLMGGEGHFGIDPVCATALSRLITLRGTTPLVRTMIQWLDDQGFDGDVDAPADDAIALRAQVSALRARAAQLEARLAPEPGATTKPPRQ